MHGELLMRFTDPREQARLESLLQRDHTLHGGILFGLDGKIIMLQARAMSVLDGPVPWRAAVKVSGMAKGTVREALDRISGAFAKYGIEEPRVEILVNLAPADLEKDGTWLDLPLAIIILQAAGILPDLREDIETEFILMGEVGLHGEVRRVPGVLSLAYIAKPGQKLIVPNGNEKECALIMAKPGHEGCKILVAKNLIDVIQFFRGAGTLPDALKQSISFQQVVPKAPDFAAIRGQAKAKEAAVIAAAGGHNLLLFGPPGEGKSLIASAIPGILPPLGRDEQVELTRIYSACGELREDGMAVTRRPFRSVHHTASRQAIIGGGSGVPRPGEVTLAHLGVLFLDELAEFSTSTLDSLRQPIEAGEVHISRVRANICYPCRFTIVAAMNPCPCGYFGTDQCRCREADVRKYIGKISGPILDRIDLQVGVERLTTEERFAEGDVAGSSQLRKQVEAARARQRARFNGSGVPYNAAIPAGQIRQLCAFTEPAFAHYRQIIDERGVSTRSMDRLAKVARTVADLADAEQVTPDHLDKAASFVIGGLLREAF
jgi:magnesium chelatase family protein